MSRLPITKTPKCYVGGAFIRSESGRVTPLSDAAGHFFANVPQCSRKDLRNAVEAAAKAGPGWAKRSAFNRGQILYRLAEMMEARAPDLAAALTLGGIAKADATREVAATIDRVIHYAGWTDKFEAVLGSVNPVASPHFNFTVTEPMGIIGLIAPTQPPLLGLLTLILPAISSGNCVVALASSEAPYPAILLGEMLATSDLPGGVVNILTGSPAELIPTFASHEHIRGIGAAVDGEARTQLRRGAADSVKRLYLPAISDSAAWFGDALQGVDAIRLWVEFKTTWHPIGS